MLCVETVLDISPVAGINLKSCGRWEAINTVVMMEDRRSLLGVISNCFVP